MSQEDRAQDEEAFQWSLVNGPRTPAPVYEPGQKEYGPEFCANDDCEDLMPELRRKMGARFCVECQAGAEARARRRY